MNKKIFFWMTIFVILCLVFVSFGVMPAYADDTTPPPEAPVEEVVPPQEDPPQDAPVVEAPVVDPAPVEEVAPAAPPAAEAPVVEETVVNEEVSPAAEDAPAPQAPVSNGGGGSNDDSEPKPESNNIEPPAPVEETGATTENSAPAEEVTSVEEVAPVEETGAIENFVAATTTFVEQAATSFLTMVIAWIGPSDQTVEDLTDLEDSNGNDLHGDVDCTSDICEKVEGTDLPAPDSNNETIIPFTVINGSIIVIHAGGGNTEYPPINLNSNDGCNQGPGGDAFCARRDENGNIVILSNPCAELVGKKNNCQPAPALSYVLSVLPKGEPTCEDLGNCTCPANTHGTWPDCLPNVCPANTHGTWPDCLPNVCPANTHGTWPDCLPNVCPANTHGTWPDCLPNVCPANTHGTWPDCLPNVCPANTHGTWPDCLPNVCPANTHGTWPDCVPDEPICGPNQTLINGVCVDNIPVDPCANLAGIPRLICQGWQWWHEYKPQTPATAVCQSGDQILSDDAKDIFWFSTNLGTKVNITSALGGVNTHGSFDPENPCLRMVFGNRENWGSAPYLWIYDGSFHQILSDGKPVQGDMADWSSKDKIAFVMEGMIFTINPDGTDLKDTGLMGNNPDWSADGKDLAFASLAGFMSVVETKSWTHVRDYIETPMAAPRIASDQKFVCGNEYCFGLPEGPAVLTEPVWGKYSDLAYDPSGAWVLTVDADSLDIVDSGYTVSGAWFNPDWFSLKKAEYIPIE